MDMLRALQDEDRCFDVIFSSFAIHHLSAEKNLDTWKAPSTPKRKAILDPIDEKSKPIKMNIFLILMMTIKILEIYSDPSSKPKVATLRPPNCSPK
jgi:hypothetical protein